MTRRELSEKVFTYIKENGFVPYDIQYENGYFIFDMGEDGVVHFKVKGLHGWKFAMWINTNAEELKNENGEDYSALQFFCQHEQNIDKFKPSRSYFCERYSLEEVDDESTFWFYNIRDMLKHIKYHPLFSFCQDLYQDKYVFKRSCLLEYLDVCWYNARHDIKEWLEQIPVYWWTRFKVALCKNCKIVKSIEIIDRNTDEWITTPRYDCHITFNRLYYNDKQDDAECKWLNFWFRKSHWSQMSILLLRDGHCNEDGKLIPYTYI